MVRLVVIFVLQLANIVKSSEILTIEPERFKEELKPLPHNTFPIPRAAQRGARRQSKTLKVRGLHSSAQNTKYFCNFAV